VVAIEEPGQPKSLEVEFHFENESLVHKLGSTMRKNMFEVTNLAGNNIAMDQPRLGE
jgi:hypothetical protein